MGMLTDLAQDLERARRAIIYLPDVRSQRVLQRYVEDLENVLIARRAQAASFGRQA